MWLDSFNVSCGAILGIASVLYILLVKQNECLLRCVCEEKVTGTKGRNVQGNHARCEGTDAQRVEAYPLLSPVKPTESTTSKIRKQHLVIRLSARGPNFRTKGIPHPCWILFSDSARRFRATSVCRGLVCLVTCSLSQHGSTRTACTCCKQECFCHAGDRWW